MKTMFTRFFAISALCVAFAGSSLAAFQVRISEVMPTSGSTIIDPSTGAVGGFTRTTSGGQPNVFTFSNAMTDASGSTFVSTPFAPLFGKYQFSMTTGTFRTPPANSDTVQEINFTANKLVGGASFLLVELLGTDYTAPINSMANGLILTDNLDLGNVPANSRAVSQSVVNLNNNGNLAGPTPSPGPTGSIFGSTEGVPTVTRGVGPQPLFTPPAGSNVSTGNFVNVQTPGTRDGGISSTSFSNTMTPFSVYTAVLIRFGAVSGAPQQVNFSSRTRLSSTAVVVPAPAGLILAMSAMPMLGFVGLVRRRRNSNAVKETIAA